MPNIVQKKATYIFSSDPALGAFNVSADGSSFNVNMQYPISIPRSAKYCTAEIHSASIWYTTPNVSAALGNNTFTFFDSANTYTLTVPDGLYNFDQLVSTLNVISSNYPLVNPFDQIFIFLPNDSTQKVSISIKQIGAYISWTLLNSMAYLFGFIPGTQTGPTPPATITAPNVAQFNLINQYLINSDLVHTGVPVNSNSSTVLGVVYIDVPPGELINFQPQNPLIVNADELIAGTRTGFRFTLTNQNGLLLNTNGEFWSFILVIRYFIEV